MVRRCFNERPCQLLDHVLTPLPPKPRATQKEHQGYVRKGGCNVLLAYNIDTGQRHLQVTTTKNKGDYAHFLDGLVQTHYPETTPRPQKASSCKTTTAPTPTGPCTNTCPSKRPVSCATNSNLTARPSMAPGSTWPKLNSPPLSRQCLDQRIGTQERLEHEVLAWQARRNAAAVKVNWSFTTEKARDKLKNRYAEVTRITGKINCQTTRACYALVRKLGA